MLLEGFKLLPLVLTAPIIVKPHLADGYEAAREQPAHLGKHAAEVGAHLLGVQPYHGVGKARVAVARGDDRLHRRQVDGGDEHVGDAGGLGAGHHLVAVGIELRAVEMAMCVYVIHKYLFKIYRYHNICRCPSYLCHHLVLSLGLHSKVSSVV